MITLVLSILALYFLWTLWSKYRKNVARLTKVHEDIDTALATSEALQYEKELNAIKSRNTKQESKNNV